MSLIKNNNRIRYIVQNQVTGSFDSKLYMTLAAAKASFGSSRPKNCDLYVIREVYLTIGNIAFRGENYRQPRFRNTSRKTLEMWAREYAETSYWSIGAKRELLMRDKAGEE